MCHLKRRILPKGSTINHLGGAWCKTKKKFVRRVAEKKNPSKGPPKKKKLRSVNLTLKKIFFFAFFLENHVIEKKISSVNFGKKIK